MLRVFYPNCQLCWLSVMLTVTCADCHLCWLSLAPSVTYAECHIHVLYAECHYYECHHSECRYAECRYAECRCSSLHAWIHAVCIFRASLMHYSCNLRPTAVAHWSNTHLTMPQSRVRVLPPLLTQKNERKWTKKFWAKMGCSTSHRAQSWTLFVHQ